MKLMLRVSSIVLAISFSTMAIAETSGLWLDVPFIKQEENGCGSASIAMVMDYWKRDADPHHIYEALYNDHANGILADEMERYLRQESFRTFVFDGQWTDLTEHLSKGRPLIVAVSEGKGRLHYIVVAGLDLSRNLIVVNDPARRKLMKIHRAEFEKRWRTTGNWTLLALPQ